MRETDIKIFDEQWLTDVETIKVFAHALRLEMIELMQAPKTVKALSAHLDIPASKL